MWTTLKKSTKKVVSIFEPVLIRFGWKRDRTGLRGFNVVTAVMGTEPGIPQNCADPAFWTLVDNSKANTLRFPGGSIANAYDLLTDTFDGSWPNQPQSHWARRLLSLNEGKVQERASFLAGCEERGIKTVLVVRCDADPFTWAPIISAEGWDIVEFGNEQELPDQRTVEPEDYLPLATQFRNFLIGSGFKGKFIIQGAIWWGDIKRGIPAQYPGWSDSWFDGEVYHYPFKLDRSDPPVYGEFERTYHPGYKPIYYTEWNYGGGPGFPFQYNDDYQEKLEEAYKILLDDRRVRVACFHALPGANKWWDNI